MSGHGAPDIDPTALDGNGLRVTVVAGRWHDEISAGLLAGAQRVLDAAGVTTTVIRGPAASSCPWSRARRSTRGPTRSSRSA